MFTEDELLPISALQHLIFCERQAALIHVERVWADNAHTARGRLLHERVDQGGDEARGSTHTLRSVSIRSLAHGLAGVADVVELRMVDGRTIPFPVEYKKGKPKSHRADEVQLCAQALCLEEMFGCSVEVGALYYGTPRRREEIEFDACLRDLTLSAAGRLRALLTAGKTPPARLTRACRSCSLEELCQPRLTGKSARDYVAALCGRGAP